MQCDILIRYATDVMSLNGCEKIHLQPGILIALELRRKLNMCQILVDLIDRESRIEARHFVMEASNVEKYSKAFVAGYRFEGGGWLYVKLRDGILPLSRG